MRIRPGTLGWLLAFALSTTACGQMTIRTWVQVIEAESSGSVLVAPFNPEPYPVTRIQGGFFSVVRLDTSQLPAPLHGTMTLEDIRIAGYAGEMLQGLCSWGDPAGASGGTVVIDLFGGGGSSADLTLDLLTTTRFSENTSVPPSAIHQPVHIDLGSGLSLGSFADAAVTGSIDGLFATRTEFTGNAELLGIPVTFHLDLSVTNKATPPTISADQLELCGKYFNQQGRDIAYVLNSKSSYLRALPPDAPKDPLVIPIADLGAYPGDRLRLTRFGTFSDLTELKDGTSATVTGVFSSSSTVLPADRQTRIPGARDAGPDFSTAPYWQCLIWPLCLPLATDIPQDFRIDPSVTVTIPSGAAFLIVAPLPPSYLWNDDSGFGFGVSVEVNPTS
jgi:hypothetical protein